MILRALALACFAACAAAVAADPVALHGRALGTTWSVKFLLPAAPADPLDPASVATRIAATLEHLEQQFSTYRPGSELSRFNASSSTAWVPVSPELAQVALASRRISELTGGAFDVTVDPLVRLWGFGPERRRDTLPSDAEIAAARVRGDFRRLAARLSPPTLRKSSAELSADFSSMAKGFAADTVSEVLTALHAPDHFVQIGGDTQTSGHSAPGVGWRTGIEQPATTTTAPAVLARIVELSGQALSTSGDSHNFITVAGRRYGHIIDPRTGRPAASALASVSVVHSSCAQSSALATALFVLGPDAGFALAAREHLACLFLVREGGTVVPHATPEFDRLAVPGPGDPPRP